MCSPKPLHTSSLSSSDHLHIADLPACWVKKSIAHCSTVFMVRFAPPASSVLGKRSWRSARSSLVCPPPKKISVLSSPACPCSTDIIQRNFTGYRPPSHDASVQPPCASPSGRGRLLRWCERVNKCKSDCKQAKGEESSFHKSPLAITGVCLICVRAWSRSAPPPLRCHPRCHHSPAACLDIS